MPTSPTDPCGNGGPRWWSRRARSLSGRARPAATAAHAYARDLSVVLVHDAIASHRPELHRPTLEMLSDEYRMPLLDVAGLVAGGLPEAREGHSPPGVQA